MLLPDGYPLIKKVKIMLHAELNDLIKNVNLENGIRSTAYYFKDRDAAVLDIVPSSKSFFINAELSLLFIKILKDSVSELNMDGYTDTLEDTKEMGISLSSSVLMEKFMEITYAGVSPADDKELEDVNNWLTDAAKEADIICFFLPCD